MTLISYAQNGEDVILWRALRHVENGFFIDIGAGDPDDLSVTRLFHDQGWSGINVEPSPAYHARCVARRPRDLNLGVAVAEQSGTLRLHDVEGIGLTKCAASATARGFTARERDVPAVPLTAIFERAGGRTVHFLKVGVEGAERAVLVGGDFARFRPWIVVVRAARPGTTERDDAEWRGILLNANYEQAYFDGLNLYFLAREHAALHDRLALQPNVLDGFRTAAAVTVEAALEQARAQHGLAEAEARRASQALDQELRARRALQARLDQLQREHEQDQATLGALRQEVERLQAERRRIEQAIDGTVSPVPATLDSLLQRMHAGFMVREQQVADAQARLAKLGAEQAQLLGSTSWLVTTPLRVARRLVAGQAPGGSLPDPSARALAQRGLRLGKRMVLAVPGLRHGAQVAARLARRDPPGAQEAPALPVVEPIAEEPVEAPLAVLAEPPPETPPPAPAPARGPDLSTEEARIHRQLAATAGHPFPTA